MTTVDLARMLEERGALPPGEVVAYVLLVAEALEPLHAAGKAYGDLRPESVLVAEEAGAAPSVTLRPAAVAEPGDAAGARPALYLAPEQVTGGAAIGPAADVYALGQIAYTLLAGEAYFQPEEEQLEAASELIARIKGGPVEPAVARALRRRQVRARAGFDAWFARATAPRPEDRFAGARAAAAALAEALRVGAAGRRLRGWASGRNESVLPALLTTIGIAVSLVIAGLTLSKRSTAMPVNAPTANAPTATPVNAPPERSSGKPPLPVAPHPTLRR